MMFNSKRNIVISGAAALAVVIVLVVAVASVTSENSTHEVIFKRCDGLTDPLKGVWISSCPNSAKVGYCEIDSNHRTRVDLTFTPGR